MNTFFIIGAVAFGIASLTLFFINKKKKSVTLSNCCVITVLLTVIMLCLLFFEADKLFDKERITNHIPVTTSAEATEYDSGRPVKDDSETTTEKTEAAPTPSQADTVYITRHGEKYHLSYTCGGNEYYKCTLTQALERGLEPCKRCVK